MLEIVLQGVLLGGLYTLFALGQSLMFGVMRLTNTAQGDFIVLAAFAAIAGISILGLSVLVASAALLPLAFGFGYALQRYVLNGTLGRDPLPSLVATFGLSILIQNLLLELFSADPRAIDAGPLATAGLALSGSISVGILPLIVLAVALLATGGLQWLFSATALGRSFRAVFDDREIAELMGLNAGKVYALATGLAFVLIAIAGLLQGSKRLSKPAFAARLSDVIATTCEAELHSPTRRAGRRRGLPSRRPTP